MVALAVAACASDDDDGAAASTTSVAVEESTITTDFAPTDPRLLTAADLGAEFQGVDSHGTRVETNCTVSVPPGTERLLASYLSEAAAQRASEEIFVYSDPDASAGAYSSAMGASRCPAQDNHDSDGTPQVATVDGADAAFTIGFADPNDSVGILVARADNVLVVLTVRFHNGPATSEGLGTVELARLALAKLGRAG